MTDRVRCKSANCERTILPATAEDTGGYCMPCVHKAAAEERERHIRQNRKDVDLFAGVTDPVEIIKIMHQPRPYDELINYLPYIKTTEQVYREMSDLDRARLLEHVIAERWPGDDREIQQIGLEIAAFTDMDLSKLQEYLLYIHEYYPGILFKNAADTVVKQLFRRARRRLGKPGPSPEGARVGGQ